MAGLDIYKAVGSYLNPDLSTSGEVSSTILDLIEQGRLGMKTGGGHLRLHAGADRRAAGKRAGEAGRRPQGARGLEKATMKLWLLDNGSIVIEHTQLMWNVARAAGAHPGLQRADRARRRPLPVRHRASTSTTWSACSRSSFPEQTAEQTIPAQLGGCGFELGDVTTLVNSHLHIDHVGGNQLFTGTASARPAREGARAGAQPRAVRVLRLLRQVVGLRGRALRAGLRRRRAGEGPLALRDARPHGRPLLACS